MKKWTIAFINYKTSVYLKWQLKSFYKFNDPKDFDIIIVDNSRPFEKDKLEQLASAYNKNYQNIKIVYYTPKAESASGQHGEAMTLAMKMADSKYFLAQDPDFFWVKKDILNYLASYLDKGMVGIGAPYILGIGGGHPNFPALWGVAHPLKLIQHLDCMAEDSKEKWDESFKLFPGKDYSYDVGWKIRWELSKEDDDSNFVAFEQVPVLNLSKKIGLHSYELITRKYMMDGEVLCYHLFRGSFTDKVDGNKDVNKDLSQELINIRDKMGEFFYTYLQTGKEPQIFSWKYLCWKIKRFIFHKEKKGKKRKLILFNVIKYSYCKK